MGNTNTRISLFIVLLALASSTSADTIQLRAKATISESTVRLSDVAALEGEMVENLSSTTIAKLEASQVSLTITQESLRACLAKAGVNWARTTLKGFEACQVSRPAAAPDQPAREPAAQVIDAPAAPVLSNPTDEVAADSSTTVRVRLTEWLRKLHNGDGDALQFTFADRDAQILDGPALTDKLVFTSAAGINLGRVPVVIQRFRGEKLVETQRLTLDLARRALAVVAVRTVNKGAVVVPGDVEVREVLLDRREGNLLTKLDDAVGLVAGINVREGAVLLKDQLRPPVLVQRNDMIEVQALAGGLLVKTKARALEDGTEGALIQVRNERSRETFVVRVIGTGMALIVGDAADGNEAQPSKRGGGGQPAKTKEAGTKK